jgi:hypothetical protein
LFTGIEDAVATSEFITRSIVPTTQVCLFDLLNTRSTNVLFITTKTRLLDRLVAGNTHSLVITEDATIAQVDWRTTRRVIERAVIAFFISLDDAIATHRQRAGVGAVIVVDRVAVITLFTDVNNGIAAAGRQTTGILGVTHLAEVVAAVVVNQVAVITRFTGVKSAVTAFATAAILRTAVAAFTKGRLAEIVTAGRIRTFLPLQIVGIPAVVFTINVTSALITVVITVVAFFTRFHRSVAAERLLAIDTIRAAASVITAVATGAGGTGTAGAFTGVLTRTAGNIDVAHFAVTPRIAARLADGQTAQVAAFVKLGNGAIASPAHPKGR